MTIKRLYFWQHFAHSIVRSDLFPHILAAFLFLQKIIQNFVFVS